jgi:ubiquinone/menaquinone biosynthesis C-methylase UbiE
VATRFLVAVLLLAAAIYFVRRRRSPSPFPPWLTPILHGPWRRLYFSPEQAADRHGLAPGMRVLEIGPGDGYFTATAVDRVGSGGQIFCLDIQLPMLRKLRAALGPSTPPLVCASGSQLPFRAGVFDAAFLVHVLGEIPDRVGALRECARVLRPEGTLAVTEGLPDPDFIRSSRLIAMASSAGLHPEQREGRSFHYTQRFGRRESATQ